MSYLYLYFMVSALSLYLWHNSKVVRSEIVKKPLFPPFLISFPSTFSFSTQSHPLTPLLTLDEIQFCEEFEFFGDVQLEVSEGWIGSQSEMLEIINCFTEPGAGKYRESSIRGIKEDGCLHDASIKSGGRVRKTTEEGGMCDDFEKIRQGYFSVFYTDPLNKLVRLIRLSLPHTVSEELDR